MNGLSFTFSGELWMYEGKGAWYFVTLPNEDADQVKFVTGGKRQGWGSVKVTAKTGDTVWNTSIFPDSKSGSYVLPVKADVRKKEQIQVGDCMTVQLTIDM
jgi:hypothetical protein